jgi:hypothetical protein
MNMIKTISKFSLIALFAIAIVSCRPAGQETQTTAAEEEGWEVLFDGTEASLQNWKSYCGGDVPDGWVIEDGALKVLGSGRGEAGSAGDIITRETYGNFELSLEWRVSEGGNSGIFYLAQEKCGENGQPIWQSAPEMQILDNERHPDARLGVDGNRQAGSLYDLIPATPQNARPVGEWNQVLITVYRGTVIHNQNGANVVEYHLWTDKWNQMVQNSKFAEYPDFVEPAQEGHIGLQDHGDDVWFRNVRIRKM